MNKKPMENWTRDDYNNWIDNCESVKAVKKLKEITDIFKKEFPNCKIKYKSKTSEEWTLYK